MENILFAVKAILPILLVILCGALARRFTPFDKAFFKRVNALAFRFFLSVNLFCNVYGVQDIHAINWRVMGFFVCCFGLSVALGVFGARLATKDPLKLGPVAQAAFRSNNAIIGIPLARALGGTAVTETVAFASLSSGISMPFYTLASVMVLTLCAEKGNAASAGAKEKLSFGKWCVKILTNPLVLGSGLGLICLAVRGILPTVDGEPVFTLSSKLPSLYKALTTLSSAASPVMLFCLGGTLDFSAGKSLWKEIGWGVALRLLICPTVVIGLALLLKNPLGLTKVEVPGLIAMFASPVSISSAVIVQEHGCDDDLGGHLVVWSSILSVGTLFLFIVGLRALGML